MSNTDKGRRFTREFKIESVRLVVEQGHRVSDVARSVGIHENTMYKWLKQYRVDPKDSFPGSGHVKRSERHQRLLEKRIADLEEENAILKKAVSIFSQESS